MKIVSKSEFIAEKSAYLSIMKSGSLVIFPTDTIYAIGCNALINNSIKKIRELKGRTTAPFSVIVPNKQWIIDNCEITDEAQEWMDKLPGPYTLVLPLKKPDFFSPELIGEGKTSICVRLPDHWISQVVQELGYPLLATSVNKKGRQFLTNPDKLDEEFEQAVSLFLNVGELEGNSPHLIRLSKD